MGKRQEVLLLIALNIILPTVDIYSDLNLAVGLFSNGYPNYGLLMMVPFLLCYLLSWVAWYNLDKRRHLTWMAAAVNCYPQYCAARVVFLLCRGNTKKAMVEKKLYEREVSEIEVFSEAVLCKFVLLFIMMKALNAETSVQSYNSNDAYESFETFNENGTIPDLEEHNLILGEKYSYNYYLFFVTLSSSAISAALGMSKVLKVGPCKILEEGGALGGLLAPRFLLLVLTVEATLMGKSCVFVTIFCAWEKESVFYSLANKIALIFCTQFLPGLLLALRSLDSLDSPDSLCHNRNSVKSILRHPSLLLLPVFSHFTFSGNSFCRANRNKEEIRVMFNRRATLVNIGLSIMGLIGFILAAASDDFLARWNGTSYVSLFPVDFAFLNWMLILSVLLTVLSMLLTLLFLYLDSFPCSAIPPLQYCAFIPSDPLTERVVDREGNGIMEMEMVEQA